MGKQVITVDHITKAAESGNHTLDVKLQDCIVTPGAWDKIEELGVRFSDNTTDPSVGKITSAINNTEKTIQKSLSKASDVGLSQVQSIAEQVCSILQEKLPEEGSVGLENLVKKVVESKLCRISPAEVNNHSSVLTIHGGAALIDGKKVLDECDGPDVPGKVSISDAIRCSESSSHATTYMKWKKASFNRTLESAEIDIIIEGELDLIIDGRTLRAKAGDILYMDKGATVTYSSPSMVKLACVNI